MPSANFPINSYGIKASAIQVYKPVNKGEVRVVYRVIYSNIPDLMNTRHQKSYSCNKYGVKGAWELARNAFNYINTHGELPEDFPTPAPPNNRSKQKTSKVSKFNSAAQASALDFFTPQVPSVLSFGFQRGDHVIFVAEGFEAPVNCQPQVIGVPLDFDFPEPVPFPTTDIGSHFLGPPASWLKQEMLEAEPFLVSSEETGLEYLRATTIAEAVSNGLSFVEPNYERRKRSKVDHDSCDWLPENFFPSGKDI